MQILLIALEMSERVKADLHGTTLTHAMCSRQVYENQTYNLLAIVVYDKKNVVGF